MDCRVCCSPASAERSGPQDSPDPVDLLRLHFDRLGTRVTRVCMCVSVGKQTADVRTARTMHKVGVDVRQRARSSIILTGHL